MKTTLLVTTTLLLLGARTPLPSVPDGEWAKGVPYTTDWKQAIKSVGETGKMLFIYNGWQREKI